MQPFRAARARGWRRTAGAAEEATDRSTQSRNAGASAGVDAVRAAPCHERAATAMFPLVHHPPCLSNGALLPAPASGWSDVVVRGFLVFAGALLRVRGSVFWRVPSAVVGRVFFGVFFGVFFCIPPFVGCDVVVGESGEDEGEGEGGSGAEGEGEGEDVSCPVDGWGVLGLGEACTFNADCGRDLRCSCSDGACVCAAGVRGCGASGVDACVDSDDCSTALCVEGQGGAFFCSGPCAVDDDCGPALPVCADIAFVGRICIREAP